MKPEEIKKLFQDVKRGKLSPDEAVQKLKHLPFEDLGHSKIDHHRRVRTGMPEIIFGQGKTATHVGSIFERLAARGSNVLATRASLVQFEDVKTRVPKAEYHSLARCITLKQDRKKYGKGRIVIVSAGTSDIPVAEEALITAETMGNDVDHVYDVGVAGIHRLLANRETIGKARVVIVCAGMEGALPSVVAGLVSAPVIAVPTSIGYGASFRGLAPLLSMLNACAAGVAVVNIDNGFGAGYLAAVINRQSRGTTEG